MGSIQTGPVVVNRNLQGSQSHIILDSSAPKINESHANSLSHFPSLEQLLNKPKPRKKLKEQLKQYNNEMISRSKKKNYLHQLNKTQENDVTRMI